MIMMAYPLGYATYHNSVSSPRSTERPILKCKRLKLFQFKWALEFVNV